MKRPAVFVSGVLQGGRSPTSFDILRDQDFRKSVNGGEKLWRLAVRGGRLNCAAPKCSVVDFVIRWKSVIMAGFRVNDPVSQIPLVSSSK